MKQFLHKRRTFIGLTSLLMAAMIYVIGRSLSGPEPDGTPLEIDPIKKPVLPYESGVFKRAGKALEYEELADVKGTRTLEKFYALRAYPGAPPVIPHEILDPQSFGGKACLSCHENGGYVPQFQAYAPVVPHPELISCRQCHVPENRGSVFRTSGWQPLERPKIKQAAMEGSPPVIPHQLQMRENCLGCHGGPGAVQEVRTTHPERVNCRQCHALGQTEEVFSRTTQ